MSNLFPGGLPSDGGRSGDDRERKPFAPRFSSGQQTDQAATPTPPRAPLFPRRDQAAPASTERSLFPPRDPAARPSFPRPAAPAAGQGTAPRPPLFPRKDQAEPTSGTSLFPPRDGATRPTFGKPASPAAANTVARPPLFPRKEADPKAAPLFAGRTAPPAPSPRPSAPSRPAFAAAAAAATAGRSGKISDEEFVLMRDFLYEQCGIFVAENRKYLVENRLTSRLKELGLRNFSEYYKYLRYDANRAQELNKFFESMTTNETSFFRNQPQLDVFRDKVLAKILADLRNKGQKKLRIWSAGCSSGEEPYTLAMILHEVLKQDISSWDIKITANDLSLAVLAAARRGLYNDYAIRTTPPEMLARYFTKEGSLYRVDPKLSQLISFGQINLSDKAQLQKVERSHIVFCRNVIIYFDDDMKRNVINSFYDNLLPGGYLIIGHSESLHNISRAFKPEHHTGSIVYCKQN